MATTEDLKAARNGAWRFEEELNADLAAGRISEAEWYERNTRTFTEAYLAKDNPRGQSGHGGDEAHYANTNATILLAIGRSGTLIDVGCANGYLAESLRRWAGGLGFDLEIHGLDISEGLIELARRRLPSMAARLYLGNAIEWRPARQFDYVLMKELGYVPPARERELLSNVFTFVAPGGRLILGPGTFERTDRELEEKLTAWGYSPDGYVERSHHRYVELCRRLYWFDR